MRRVVWYRASEMPAEELEAAERYFDCVDSRVHLREDDLVVGRYSVLPFYREQEHDVNLVGAKLINSWSDHNFLADAVQYSDVLREMTFRIWEDSESMMKDESYEGPYVVKGCTNSRKDRWRTHMYAADKSEAIRVMIRLQDDGLIGQQDIVFREFVPLRRLAWGLSGIPISDEHRFFVCAGEVLSGAFYWSSYRDSLERQPDPEGAESFVRDVAARLKGEMGLMRRPPFYVVDVARRASDNSWVVVELNDGQMSGLSEHDPDELYRKLQGALADG